MKKIISFEKELTFPSMIGEINSISLDQSIEFKDSNFAAGEFIVSGTYKMTEASTLVEDFKYNIPVEITLIENLDLDSTKISISDFNYEIINDDTLKCNIDLLIEGIETITLEEDFKEEIEKQEEELVRECDGDKKEKYNNEEFKNEIEMKTAELDEISNSKIDEENNISNSNNISSLFNVFDNSEETFITYSVYIMRKEDTLENVMDKYKISREQLSEYNDLNSLEIGSKLIIPTSNE